MDATFTLHEQLARDCVALGDFPLCRLLLMNDAQYPWFILVPRRAGMREIHELAQRDRRQLWEESDALSRWLATSYKPDKLNIAMLGNVVPQLHLHHIARFRTDAAWPRPVWGLQPALPYNPDTTAEIRRKLEDLKKAGFEPALP